MSAWTHRAVIQADYLVSLRVASSALGAAGGRASLRPASLCISASAILTIFLSFYSNHLFANAVIFDAACLVSSLTTLKAPLTRARACSVNLPVRLISVAARSRFERRTCIADSASRYCVCTARKSGSKSFILRGAVLRLFGCHWGVIYRARQQAARHQCVCGC